MVRLYYYNPKKVIDRVAAQVRGKYAIRIRPGTGTAAKKREFDFILREENRFKLVETAFYLPIPDVETAGAPNLLKPPVPYKF